MEMIAMDLIQLPLTESGNRYCLTAMCLCKHFIWIVPIPDKQTEMVIQAYLQNVYAKAGGSKYILTDRGGEFTSAQMKALANKLGFIKVYTSPYRPQSNSVLECAHGFVNQSLTQIVTNHQVEWDTVHHIVEMAYNVFPTRANRESPFFFMFQQDCYIPTLM